MHNAIMTAMDKMVIPRVEVAVRSITGSSGHGPSSEGQNTDRMDFLGNAGNTPRMSAPNRLYLNTNQDRNDETRKEENFEDGNFSALRRNYDRRASAHHLMTGHNTTTHHSYLGNPQKIIACKIFACIHIVPLPS